MKLNVEKISRLLIGKGWSEVIFAQKLGLDYSYVYQVMHNQRGVGKKFLTGLIKLCEKECLNFIGYILLVN
ncbi:MAG: hypothetical protein KAX49_11410 [Halanaerobiales bacterium]|nr:hypothetical protein [Halanaerobiales bacterium]